MHQKTREALSRLKTMIQLGRIGKDGLLPSERDLGELLGVGRGAVRAIGRELCAAGTLTGGANGRMKITASVENRNRFQRFLTIAPEPSASQETLRILRCIADSAAEEGAEMVLGSPADTAGLAGRCAVHGYAGVIFFEQCDRELAAGLAATGLPLMVSNVEIYSNLPSVGVDYRQIGRLAGRTLVEAGHRRIGYIGGRKDAYVTREIIAGLKGALAEDDLQPDYGAFRDFPVYGPAVFDQLHHLLRRPNRPSAFILGRDHLGHYFFQVCRELKIRIPEDISVIGYDNLSWPEGEAFGLTTIAQPVEQIGNESVALLRRLYSDAADGNEHIRIPGALIRRVSIAAPPSRRMVRP